MNRQRRKQGSAPGNMAGWGKHPLLGLLINSPLSDLNRVIKFNNQKVPLNSLDCVAAADRLELNCTDKENLITARKRR